MKFSHVNYLIDTIMPQCNNGNAFKVVSVIARETWGRKDRGHVELSYSELMELTAIGSVNTLKKAIKDAEPFIIQVENDTQGFTYSMRTMSITDTVEAETLSEIDTVDESTMSEIDTEPYQKLIQSISEVDTVQSISFKEKEIKNNDIDVNFSKAIKAYENNIGPIGPKVSVFIGDAVDEYSIDWIIEAIGIAVKNNVRKWNYISRILENWKTEGRAARAVRESNGVAQAWAEVKQQAANGSRPQFSDNRILTAVSPLWPSIKTMTSYTERELKTQFERNYNAAS